MRHNFFGDPYAQPGDSYDDVAFAFEAKFGEMPEFCQASFYPETEKEEDFKCGGYLLASNADGEFGFDGFETVDEAKAWVRETIGLTDEQFEDI